MPGQEWSRRPRAAVFGVPPLAGHLHSECVSSPTMGLARWKGVLLRGKRPRDGSSRMSSNKDAVGIVRTSGMPIRQVADELG